MKELEVMNNEEMENTNGGGIGSAAIGVTVGFGMGCLQEIAVSTIKGQTPTGKSIFKSGAKKAVTSGVAGAIFGPF